MRLPANRDPSSACGSEAPYEIRSEPSTPSCELSDVLFDLCQACVLEAMSCIPPSAFSARRIRDTQRDLKVSNVSSKGGEPPKYFNTTFMELTPLKYNSKLMNSIWGFYNRYSPHNVKKINDALVYPGDSQQYAASSGAKNDAVLGLPAANLWAMNMPQSH